MNDFKLTLVRFCINLHNQELSTLSNLEQELRKLNNLNRDLSPPLNEIIKKISNIVASLQVRDSQISTADIIKIDYYIDLIFKILSI